VILDEAKALQIHRKYGSSPAIVEHCRTVARISEIIGRELVERGVSVDEEVVLAGALLHDIGRTKVQTVRHGYVGAEILKREGLPESVADVVKKHVGAGISYEEARRLGLPDGDYIPRTLEEKVVCFADKMVDANKTRPFAEEVKRFVRKGHDVRRLEGLKEDLKLKLGRDPEKLIFEKITERT